MYVTQTSDKSKKTALLLCAVGGMLGLHQFYVGNIGKGLLYVCTVGLLFFGWWRDLYLISLGKFKDNTGAPLRASGKQLNPEQASPTIVINNGVADTRKGTESEVDKIMKLAELKEKGLITEEEFNTQKAKYLQ